MASVIYYVAMGFRHDAEGELIALDPTEAQTHSAAVAQARSLAGKEAGAIAFSRTGDPDLGEFGNAKVLWQGGEVPDQIPQG